MPAWESETAFVLFPSVRNRPDHRAVPTAPGRIMEFYSFVRTSLAWIASIALLYPVNVPLLFAAHRIREGRVAEDDENRMENDEVWTRSFLGALVVALLLLAFLFGDLVLADWLGLPAGIIHMVVLITYLAAASFLLMQFFAYDDYFYGLSLLSLYLFLPIFVLLAVNSLVGFWNPVLGFFLNYIKEVRA